ncbi:hypothetical protein GR702_21285 [Novosphingobium sp. FGD1]|uniref:Polysaccharide pyruvyl transferase domain-containing protein n=1 Tax=Novosphingobium silvae TaxID=2692619 RepID=A0A7X4K8K5_9SPHN|nr:polysaccharide pyruvyl transferase family protein [Novosphingobium silvae]MYM00282.1 hypothetical protein [Novosphingobium silvae]
MKLLRYRPAVPNFGDDLNDLIWPELAPGLFDSDGGEGADAFVGIGTIIGLDPQGSESLHVFSSGTGYSDDRRWRGRKVEYHCVRGPLTARVLGLPNKTALTDGGILAPLITRFQEPNAFGGTGGTVVVPHFETIAFPGWAEAVGMAGFHLVDPRGTPDLVIGALKDASLVLTESLHGAILADAFGVPWRAFAVSRNFSRAKWADWTCSLDLRVDVTLVPPPDAMPLLRFGKPPEAFGSVFALNEELALGEFRGRIQTAAEVPFMKARVKQVLEAIPATRKFLGFSPERTARALADLAAADPCLSSFHRRDALRDEMLCRLQALEKRYEQAPVLTA